MDHVHCSLLGEAPTGILGAYGDMTRTPTTFHPVEVRNGALTFPAKDPGVYHIVGPTIAESVIKVVDGEDRLECAEPVALVHLDALVRGEVTGGGGDGPIWLEGCDLPKPGFTLWGQSPGVQVDLEPPNGYPEWYALRIPRGTCQLRACNQHGGIHLCGRWTDVDTSATGFAEVDLALPEGTPGGVGLRIQIDPEGISIDKLLPGGPADRAGVVEGSRIVAIDGQPIRKDTTYEAFLERVAGPVGTEVTLSLVEPGGVARDYVLLREALPDRTRWPE